MVGLPWSRYEDCLLCECVNKIGCYSWKFIAETYNQRRPHNSEIRNDQACLRRWNYINYNHGMWTKRERRILRKEVERQSQTYKFVDWKRVSGCVQTRSNKQCRERWEKRVKFKCRSSTNIFTIHDDQLLRSLYERFPSQWIRISRHFPHFSKRVLKQRWALLRHWKEIESIHTECLKNTLLDPDQIPIPSFNFDCDGNNPILFIS